ncbi:superoxide dismutase [Oleidesulfovibrio sp.]|uniref:superoxide dismutase n=1 Tax=Oleidesulfovibrio sp. TaxID=2909707 RepID=UPI003A8B21A4
MQPSNAGFKLALNRRQFMKLAAGAGVLAGASIIGISPFAFAAEAFPLPALPYPENALEPYISVKTISFHYGKHTRAYYANTGKLAVGQAGTPLHDVFLNAAKNKDQQALFNNAAQAWNHTFYWNGMKPSGGGLPSGKLMEQITASFGSYEAFRDAFSAAAKGQFGSGWAWLVQNKDKMLEVVATPNAANPMVDGKMPILVCDVWEHAYYLDYQNRRADYVKNFLEHLVNWEEAARHLA